jgi:MOSC domain-containing protein YiiM
VVGIFIASRAAEPLEERSEIRAIEGRGLEGDRYLAGEGTWSSRGGAGRHVTLIECEAVDELRSRDGIDLRPEDLRRNLVTEGVALADLVGRELRVGDVVLRGIRLCEPCAHIEALTHPGVVTGLVHRAGLRADIVEGGTIRVGDPIVGVE